MRAHDAEITVVEILGDGVLLTAGRDGRLKWWDADFIEAFEPTEENPRCEMKPSKEVAVPADGPVVSMLENETTWM